MHTEISNTSDVATLARTAALIRRRDGVQGFYRGASIPVLGSCFVGAAAFTTYGKIRPWLGNLMERNMGFPAILQTMIGGAAAGAAGATCSHPLHAVVSVRHQELEQRMRFEVVAGTPGRAVLRSVVREGGYAGLFHGLHLALLRAVPLNAVVFFRL